jgi:plasmid stabilization system protein ParE
MKTYEIIVTAEAEKDLRDAIKWYTQQQKGLGNTFYKNINKAFTIIKNNPLAFENRYAEVRTFTMRKFPFLIHYIIFNNNIYIVNILHTAQDWLK